MEWVEELSYNRYSGGYYDYLESRMKEIRDDIYKRLSRKVDSSYVEEYADLLIWAYEKGLPGSDCLEEYMDTALDIPAVLGDMDEFDYQLRDTTDYRDGDDQ